MIHTAIWTIVILLFLQGVVGLIWANATVLQGKEIGLAAAKYLWIGNTIKDYKQWKNDKK